MGSFLMIALNPFPKERGNPVFAAGEHTHGSVRPRTVEGAKKDPSGAQSHQRGERQ